MKPRIVLVTDPAFGDDVIVRCTERVAAALPPGALCVQLRDKARSIASLRVMACRLRIVTGRSGALLVINGQPRLARDVGADGVHLGGDAGTVADARMAFGRPTWISVAAHSDDDVRRALGDGADAALVSPIFATRAPSFLDGSVEKPARGLAALRAARAIGGPRLAVFALGGVSLERVRRCAKAGADGVAVMRALLTSDKPDVLARAIHDLLAPRW
jgi:thiamine-phosphate pyrophosphorylase